VILLNALTNVMMEELMFTITQNAWAQKSLRLRELEEDSQLLEF
jgi:hypothetical protein